MGPFELVDLVGLDTRLNILEYLYKTLGEKYRPAPLLVQTSKLAAWGGKPDAEFTNILTRNRRLFSKRRRSPKQAISNRRASSAVFHGYLLMS